MATVPIDRLTPDDEIMLEASEQWPQDIVAVAMLDGERLVHPDGVAIERLRDVIEARLHLVPRLRQVIRIPSRWLGAPYWVDAAPFDLRAHVHHLALEAPAGEDALLHAVEELRRRPFEVSRPMWAMWFVTGLADGRVAWVVKIHHAMTDGLAAMTTIRSLLDPMDERTAAPAPWRPRPAPTQRELLVDAMRRRLRAIAAVLAALARPLQLWRDWRAAWPALRELVGERPASRTSVDALIGRDRVNAWLRVPVASVRQITRAHHASVNDVLLALTEAGLGALLRGRGERTRGRFLRAYVPVTLRRRLGGAQHGNRVSQMVVPLRLDVADASARLQRIAADTTRRKGRPRIALGALFGGRLAGWLLLRAVIRQRVNISTASIPGGARRRSLAGAALLDVVPVLALIGNVPLGVGAVAYGDTLGIGVTADRATYPDLDVLVAAMRSELDALHAAAAHRSRTTPERAATIAAPMPAS